ncbi:MAG: tetratricopeptide repeat protein [Terracidiphilus sp.]
MALNKQEILAVALCVALQAAGGTALSGQTHSQVEPWQIDFQRGIQELQAGQFGDAEKDFREVVRLRPAFAPGYLNLALVVSSEQRPQEAVELLNHAIGLDPTLRGARLFAGIQEYKLGNYALAVEHLKKAVAAFPKDPQGWMWLGIVDLALGHSREAAAALDKAADLDSKNVDIMYHRGRAHMELSKDIYEDMLKAAPDSWRVHEVLAQAYDEQGNPTQAVLEFKHAIEVAPTEGGLHESLGDDEWQLNDLDAARAAYERETVIDPNNASAIYKLGAVLVEQSQPEQAIPYFKKALALNSGMYQANFWLGRAEQAMSLDADAVNDFTTAATHPGVDSATAETAWYHLAQLYRKLNQKDKEQQAMQEFRELRAKSDAEKSQLLNEKKNSQLGHDPGVPAIR